MPAHPADGLAAIGDVLRPDAFLGLGAEDIVAAEVKKNLNLSVGPSEYQAWKNSLGNAMSHVMLDSKIPDDAAETIQTFGDAVKHISEAV